MGTGDSGVEGCVLFVRIAAFGWVVGVLQGGDFVDAEGVAGSAERLGAAAVCQDPEVADALEAVGKDMEEEAPDELVRGERRGSVAGLALSRPFRLPGAEGDLLSIEGQDAPVADRDSVCVSGEISEDVLGAPEGSLSRRRSSRFGGRAARSARNAIGSAQRGGTALEAELFLFPGLGELLEETASEETGEHLDGGEEGTASRFPFAGCDIEACVGDDDVKVGMESQPLVPGVQDGGPADAHSAVAGVLGNGAQGLGGGTEEDIEDRPAVGGHDAGQFAGQGEDDLEVRDGEDVPGASVHPPARGTALAGRAVPVAAGVVDRMLAPATLALVEVPAQRRGPAALDGGHDLAAAGIEAAGEAVAEGGTGLAEDLRHAGALRVHLASVAKQSEPGERVVQLVEHLARRASVAARRVGVAVPQHVPDHLDVAAPLMPVSCGAVAPMSCTR